MRMRMRMRLLIAITIVMSFMLPEAQAGRARDGFGTSSRCHCDRYLNPHYTERLRRSEGGSSYRVPSDRGTASRRY